MRKATLSLTAARGIGPLISFVLIVLLGRMRGPEEVGYFGIALAAFALMEAVTSLGMRHLLPRELAGSADKGVVTTAAAVCFGTGILLSLLIIPILITFVEGAAASVILFVLPALPIAGLMVVAEGYWLARFRVSRVINALLVEQLVRGALSIVLLSTGYGVKSLILSFVIGRCVAFSIAIPDCGWQRPRIDMLRSLLKQVPPFVALELCFQAYWRVDVILLGILSTARETGYYVVAYRLFSGLLLLPQSYGQILLPRFSITKDAGLLRKSLRDMLFAGIVLFIFIHIVGYRIIDVLYGGGYERSGSILLILAIGFIGACVDQPQGRLLIARGRQLWDLSALSGAVVVNVILNLILIPPYGGIGAAWATVLSLFVSVTIHGVGIRNLPAPTADEA